MVKDKTHSRTEILTLENTLGVKLKEWVNTPGETATFTQANSSTVRNMDKATGRKVGEQIQTSTRETTTKTKSTGMESFYGAQAANIKVTTMTILRKDTVRCTGLMGVYIEDSGRRVFNQALVL